MRVCRRGWAGDEGRASIDALSRAESCPSSRACGSPSSSFFFSLSFFSPYLSTTLVAAPPEPLPQRSEAQTTDAALASRATGKAFRVHSRVFSVVERLSPLHALSVAGARVEAPAEIEPDVLDAVIDVIYALAHNKEDGRLSAFVEYDDLASLWSAASVLDLDCVKECITATIRLSLSLHNGVYFLEVGHALEMPGIVKACVDVIASDPEAAFAFPGRVEPEAVGLVAAGRRGSAALCSLEHKKGPHGQAAPLRPHVAPFPPSRHSLLHPNAALRL